MPPSSSGCDEGSTSFCLAPAPKETYAWVCGATGLVRWGGTSPANKRMTKQRSVEAPNGHSRRGQTVSDAPNMGGSTLSMYANGSGREGTVSNGSAHANGELLAGVVAERLGSEYGECDES